ncbi:MAG TPA: hypothetical protein VK871_10835, partial [Candidatus Limnocylindrales bacterium]|nr:hypothetical protein [Candidatus Limnocylindrales bacterium]
MRSLRPAAAALVVVLALAACGGAGQTPSVQPSSPSASPGVASPTPATTPSAAAAESPQATPSVEPGPPALGWSPRTVAGPAPDAR